MKAKVFVIPVFLFSFFHLFSQVQWVNIPTPVVENFTAAWMPEETKIIIVSEQGTIVGSNDGGNTWYDSSLGDYNLTSIYFIDDSNGFIAGYSDDNAIVFVTDDGGDNWQPVEIEGITEANSVFFSTPDNGVVAGYYENTDLNECYYTTDGGQNWNPSSFPHILESKFKDVSFRNDTIGNMVGTDGIFYSTNNGGENWGMNITFPVNDLNGIFNFGDQNGVVVGNGGKAHYTINQWYQHSESNTSVTANLNAVCGAPGTNKIWAVGDGGTIIFTENIMLGWVEQSSGTTENLNDVFILNENSGVVVGDNGTVLLMSSPNAVYEKERLPEISVFPNPFGRRTTIRYDVSSQSFIELKIFDMLGNEVLQLFAGEKQPGSYKAALDASGLQNGIYFVRLNAGNFSSFKKIVITD